MRLSRRTVVKSASTRSRSVLHSPSTSSANSCGSISVASSPTCPPGAQCSAAVRNNASRSSGTVMSERRSPPIITRLAAVASRRQVRPSAHIHSADGTRSVARARAATSRSMPVNCRSCAPSAVKIRPPPQPISRIGPDDSAATPRQYARSPSAAAVRSRSSARRRLRTSEAVSFSGMVPNESSRRTPCALRAR